MRLSEGEVEKLEQSIKIIREVINNLIDKASRCDDFEDAVFNGMDIGYLTAAIELIRNILEG